MSLFRNEVFYLLCFFQLFFVENAFSNDYAEFDPSFLQVKNDAVLDVQRFYWGANASPGIYPSALYVNGKYKKDVNLIIEFDAKTKNTYPCINEYVLSNVDFDKKQVPADFFSTLKEQKCIDIAKSIPEAKASFDSNESRIDIEIPQIYMAKKIRGSVDSENWDKGINGFLFDYNLNAYNRKSNGERYQSVYSSVNTGFNFEGWYFRQNGNFNWSDDTGVQYTSLNAYVMKDIPTWRSRVVIGQSYTKGRLFDSLPFSGIQLFSEDRMLPSSQRGYAPEIRGIASTNARVVVRQSNQIIYETTVSPGEFLINDLYPTGFGGDLDVTVIEADGSEHYFSVPYTAMADLLRPKFSRYSLVAGQYRNSGLISAPMFIEGTYQRGLTNSLTGYGGFQANPNYYALQLGSAVGTSVGAFSLDVTQAFSMMPEGYEDQSGQSFQFKYSKNISQTGSNLSLAAYRFSTEGYLDFKSAMNTRDYIQRGENYDNINRSKNRFIVTATQDLPTNWGQFYISSLYETYWNVGDSNRQYQLGYNNQYKNLTWGLNVSRSETDTGIDQTTYTLNLSLPLGTSSSYFSPILRSSINYDSNGNQRQQLGITDTVGENNQWNYGVTASHANKGIGSTADVNLGYRSPYSTVNMNYSAGENYQGQSVGLSGSMIAHSGGLTLSPYTGTTYGLVEAKGAEGASISGYPGVKVDGNGYAIVPNMNPYEVNSVGIDPKGTSDSIELVTTSQNVAPNANAIALLKYQTKYGKALLISSTYKKQPVPFGATVTDESGNNVGLVGQNGQIYARVEHDTGTLMVSWGNRSIDKCKITYQINDTSSRLPKLNAICEN